jgi:hypothetical protein
MIEFRLIHKMFNGDTKPQKVRSDFPVITVRIAKLCLKKAMSKGHSFV